MKRILPALAAWSLHDVAATRAIEQAAHAALGANVLMRRAGECVARLANALAPHARTIWVAAGPGNNGGDGLEAAAWLRRQGKRVVVGLFGAPEALPDEARDAYARAQAQGVPIRPDEGIDFAPDLAIDALLGIGARRAPDARLVQWIERMNSLPCPVLAVDVPSGLHADHGTALGESCVTATHTLSLLTLKPGLFTGSGRDRSGTVWFDPLGVDSAGTAPNAWLSGRTELRAWLPARRHAQHKGNFGDVGIVGGAAGMSGAAWLAARAALAAGAGRVYVDLLDPAGSVFDATRPELMVRPGWSRAAPQILRESLAVCGCGGGNAVRAVLPGLLGQVPRLVLDADALNATAQDTQLQSALAARAGRRYATVLTPHPLEAARLLGTNAAQVQADRIGAATQLARRWNCVVVLKGSGSIIAAPDRAPRINSTGSAALASAGTGDVLAGWLGGWWAQRGRQTDFHAELGAAFEAASGAVLLHGLAAEAAPSGPLLAADLVEHMHELQRAVRGSARDAGVSR